MIRAARWTPPATGHIRYHRVSARALLLANRLTFFQLESYLEVIFGQIFALLGYRDPLVNVATPAALSTATGRLSNGRRRLQRHGRRRGRRERPRRLLCRDDLEGLAVQCWKS